MCGTLTLSLPPCPPTRGSGEEEKEGPSCVLPEGIPQGRALRLCGYTPRVLRTASLPPPPVNEKGWKVKRAIKRVNHLHAAGQCKTACCDELARLRKDKARLDWLQAVMDSGLVWAIFRPIGKDTVRQAIDKGVKTFRAQEKKK
jgi:hypothetical protein